MKNFQILNDIPVLSYYEDLKNLIKTEKLKWTDNNQICINTTPDDLDNYLKGIGSLIYNWNSKEIHTDEFGNQKVVIPKHLKPLKEEDFSELCTQFKNTSFEEIFNFFKKEYKIGRIRLMKLKPKTCLTWHTDSSCRIHYPLKTQEGCFMIIDDEIKHLTQNTWWWTNTILSHTVLNSSNEDRIHLVVTLLE